MQHQVREDRERCRGFLIRIARTLHAPGNRTHGLHRRGLHDSVGARPPVGIAARPARRMRAGKGHLAKFRKRIGGRHRNLADSERVHGAHMVTFIRSEEHTSELQSLMRISYALFCLKQKTTTKNLVRRTKSMQEESK